MRGSLIWVVSGLVVLGLSFLTFSPYVAYATYAFLLLVGMAHLSSWLWLTGLECRRTVSRETVHQGETVEVEVTLTNRRGWPIPWLFIEDLHPRDFPRVGDYGRLSILMPGRSIGLKYSVRCTRRGYHRLGPLLMESGDLFGLHRRFRTGDRRDYISVLPTVAYIETFSIGARRPQGPVRISNRIYEDPTRIAGLREYHPGDPLNRIHWKASARTGDLYTRQNEPSNVLGATLVLDLHRSGYEGESAERRIELAVTTAASIAYLLQLSGEQLGMITNACDAAELARYEAESQQSDSRQDAEAGVVEDDTSDRLRPLAVPTRRSPVQAAHIIENLARVMPGDGLDVAQLLLEEFRRLPRDATLIPIVPRVSPELALVLAEMRLSGFAVSVFVIGNDPAYREAAALLAHDAIHVFNIEHERDLHAISPARI